MKTTIEIADSLLDEARELAAGENTTLRALVEAGLRQVISERKYQPPFRLRDTSFCGNHNTFVATAMPLKAAKSPVATAMMPIRCREKKPLDGEIAARYGTLIRSALVRVC